MGLKKKKIYALFEKEGREMGRGTRKYLIILIINLGVPRIRGEIDTSLQKYKPLEETFLKYLWFRSALRCGEFHVPWVNYEL